jgi:serine protease Do/serine protease DegQ
MADQEHQQTEAPYIREKIRKKKPNPLRFFARILMCVLLAVVFGAVAGFVFVVVRPWAEQIGITQESSTASTVELPTFTQDNTTADIVENTTEETTEESSPIDEEEVAFSDTQRQWIRSLISTMIDRDSLDISDVDVLDRALRRVYQQAEKSIAAISGFSVEEGAEGQLLWQASGILFYKNEETDELLILADADAVEDTGDIRVELPTLPDSTFSAAVKGWDHIFGLVVLAVSTDSLSKDELSKVSITEIGNSYQVSACDTVLLVGAPYGVEGSVAVGRVTCVDVNRVTLDSVYRLFDTDITLPESAGGFMINTSGQLVGILTSSLKDGALASFGVAVGTEELKGSLNNMINGISTSLLGVYGSDVTETLILQGMPAGVYVQDVQADGPAYNAGISAGDIITGISMSEITSVSELTQCMTEKHLPGETVIVQVMRQSPEGYKAMEISVTLGAR